MKRAKNSNILIVGLALLLSLVSFTGVVSHSPIEAVKTVLVVSDFNTDTRFSITYQDAIKDDIYPFIRYYEFGFTQVLKHHNLKENAFYKTYTYKILGLNAEQLHTKRYSLHAHQTLYNAIV